MPGMSHLHPLTGTNDMREQNIFEAVASKKSQLFLATQVSSSVRM